MSRPAILPQFSAFVSASAGSGKTKTLIDRLLNLLLSNIAPSKILCLAFTKAAAAEILTRINQKLSFFITCDREILLQELRDLGFSEVSAELELKARTLFAESLDEVEPLNIQTIHSFCQQLLSQFPLEAGVSLNFNLLSDNKVSRLIEQAKNILLSNIDNYAYASDSMRYLSWHIKEYTLNELMREIINNRTKLDGFFSHYSSLDEVLKSEIDEKSAIADFIGAIPFNLEQVNRLYEGSKTDINRAEKLKQFLNSSLEMKIMLINDYLACYLTQEGAATKMLATKNIREAYPDFVEELRLEQQRVLEFDQALRQIKAQRLTRAFTVISYHIRKIYAYLKQQVAGLDYDDLIRLANDLLNNSEYAEWICYKLDGGIDHILVDEAQDTSLVQWQIINKMSEEFFYSQDKLRSIFIVGDAKQSIFSFQGAEPELFNAMNYQMPEEVVRSQLNKSFRSARKILQLVDKIFNQAHIKPLVTGIESVIEHIAHKDMEGEVELWPLVLDEELLESKPWALPSDFIHQDNKTGEEKLAQQVGQYIKAELENGNIKNPGDVMILTRRRTGFVNKIISELRAENIPVTGLDRLKLMDHPAILDLLALINFLLYQNDDFNLAIILKSPICAMSEEQLLELCYNRSGSLWEALSDKIFLTELIELSKAKSIFEFFFALLEYKGLRLSFMREFGQESNDVLDSFLDLILQFEAENISSLQLFLEFLNSNKTEVKRDLSHSAGQVRVMTIHGAKGLQAPMVILADTTSIPHLSSSIVWLNEKELLWPGREKYYPEEAIQARALKQAQEYAEYLRLLYVAVTRAESKLIICGSAKGEEVSPRSWYAIIKAVIEETDVRSEPESNIVVCY